MASLRDKILRAAAAMPDAPTGESLKLYASGPAMEAAFKATYGDQFEIVRTDLANRFGNPPVTD